MRHDAIAPAIPSASAIPGPTATVDATAVPRHATATGGRVLAGLSVSLSLLVAAPPALGAGLTPAAGDWTVSTLVGTSRLADPSVRFSPAAGSPSTGGIGLGGGSVVGGSVGRYLRPDLRIEAEFTYRSDSVDTSSVPGLALGGATGDYASTMLMANLVKTFHGWRAGFAHFRPYVGLGLGLATEIDADLPLGGAEREFSARDRFAWQAMAGVEWTYDSGWFAGAGVRWLDAGRVRLESGTGDSVVEADYGGLSAQIRVGYRF